MAYIFLFFSFDNIICMVYILTNFDHFLQIQIHLLKYNYSKTNTIILLLSKYKYYPKLVHKRLKTILNIKSIRF